MAQHNEIGKIGENIALNFLVKNKFEILERNYRARGGEIDIIAKKDNVLRFVEVKSIQVASLLDIQNINITPEDNLTFTKKKRLLFAIKTFLSHKNIDHDTACTVDLACVYINTKERQGRVKLIENIDI